MNGKFKILGALLVMLATVLVPQTSFAGWGAIACNQNNSSCGVSYGWANLGSAKSYALVECLKSNRSCHVWQWEHNMCIHGPYGSYTCN